MEEIIQDAGVMQIVNANSFIGDQLTAAIRILSEYTLNREPVKYQGDSNKWYWAVLVDGKIYLWEA